MVQGRTRDDLHSAINAAVSHRNPGTGTGTAAGIETASGFASFAASDPGTGTAAPEENTSSTLYSSFFPPDNTSPPPTAMSTSRVAPQVEREAILAQRTASIDSTVSSISSVSGTATARSNGTNAYRVSQDTAEDAASLIAAAGSAEAALHKVLCEKQQAASHNAQLWRLVEKQRTMILGLNRDLEKSLKEKERYRRKLKDSVAQSSSSASVPALTTATTLEQEPNSRRTSLSPARDESTTESSEARMTSDVIDSFPQVANRSDTPQNASALSSAKLAPLTSTVNASLRDSDREGAVITAAAINPNILAALQRSPAGTDPMQPLRTPASPQVDRQKTPISPCQTTASPSAQSVSSPKTRKAPPTPLKLNPPKPGINVKNDIIDASDSEYEDDPESARSDYLDRGRRKTREEDDRQREIQAQQEAQQEAEHRSRSKKNKHSQSKTPVEKTDIPTVVPVTDTVQELRTQAAIFDPTANPAEILRNRAVSDATNMLRNNVAPSLMSPGLPMSPRPGDRPPNSPMPRALHAVSNSIPMSPKAGMPAGLPLSPRMPRHAIPLPPQTPVSMMSPHLDRAKAYHQQMQRHPHSLQSFNESLKPGNDDRSPERERMSSLSDPSVLTPGEVYRGYVSEQYPGLLLPPNALPSIFVKTASSRMRPSRASFIAPKTADENPVFTLSVHERSDGKQLWQVEKTFVALATLDQQVKSICMIRERLPEKALFAGHAPAKIDARRMALNYYLERMLDAITEERAATVVCKFLSTDAIEGDNGDYLGSNNGSRPDSPVAQLRPNRAGYLTKRGKNFGGWKARYFVLDGPHLKYFEGPGGAHMGSIKLQNAQIGKQSSSVAQNANEDEDNQFRHAFLILEPKKKDSTSLVRHVLCAESDEERDAWVDALLQYVDFKDDEEPHLARQAQVSKTEAPRSPRPQKSMSDLNKVAGAQAAQTRSVDQVRAVQYSETVAGSAPVMGQAPLSPRLGTQTPSPTSDQLTTGSDQHPTISAPTNLQVIQNAGDWGMRPPPTPGSREKKRSVFQLPFTNRGRSSSDLQPGDKGMSPAAPERPYGSKVIFGVPLAEAVAAAQPANVSTELPAVVYRCIEYLTYRNAIAEEGIFRLSGSNTVIRSLKERFNTEGDVNLITDDTYYDVHAVASLLKLYLRELPASILTRDLHLDFLHTLDIVGNDKIVVLNALVNRLPRPNRALLEALSAFMLLIVNNVGVNKMSVRNRKSISYLEPGVKSVADSTSLQSELSSPRH